MPDRPPINELEADARRAVVSVARSMVLGDLSFFEGAAQILTLRSQLGGVADDDEDFDAFVLIVSETDNLPLEAQRPNWSPQAVQRLEFEFKKVQEWASKFAIDPCLKLIARFDHG